jgi:aspartyl-tRNA(Asn)/glutamyl-tRNA(Gln) amidotransferase subunit A
VERYTKLSSIQADIRSKKNTVVAIVSNYLQTINDNKNLNVFLEVFEEEALQRAKEIQEKIDNNKAGRLAGMVLAIKDNLCYKGHVVSAASKILQNYRAVYTSTAVQRLISEDAIIIGRTNCDEFAMGASNENSAFGPVLNYADNTRVSGGSSGGAAVAVQANMCLASIGSDTGGSIRQPAAFCGAIGLKPTYGRVSRYGLIAYASSFDQIGPITQSVEDAAVILEVIGGKDNNDATTSSEPITPYTHSFRKSRVAYIKEALNHPALDVEVKRQTEEVIDKLKRDGHMVEEVGFEMLDALVPAYYVMTTAEASSNLSRFSGLLFGHRSNLSNGIDGTFKKSRSEGFGKEVKRRIMLGTFVLSSGFYDAYYSKAQKVRRKVKEETERILSEYDFILSPVTPSTAFKFGEKSNNPIEMYLADMFTVHANISGHPAISFPIGHHNNGMPIGLQLLGKNFAENDLLNMAAHIMA